MPTTDVSPALCEIRARPYVLAATILGSSLAFIDGTVVHVALPALQSTFHATAIDVQWVIESYALFLAALLLVGGSLGDHFGRRRIYAIGVVLFTLASIWCGLAPSITHLIAARAIQGIGGALLVPGSLAIISTSFPKDVRGQAIGTWSAFTAITATVGPVLGGWIIQHISWRAAFYINVPIAIAVLALTFKFVPESRDEKSAAELDWLGALLATASLGALVYGLIESSSRGFTDSTVLASLASGVIASALFFFVESRHKNPMLPLALFRSMDFSGANLLTFLLYAALSGMLYFLPQNLIQVQGYSATAAGAALLPALLILFFLSRWAGGLVARYGARLPLVVGPLIAAAGFALFARPGAHANYWTTFFPAAILFGFGFAISVAPLTTTVMNAVDERWAGIASGINNAVSRTAGLISVAAFGIVMLQIFAQRFEQSLRAIPLPPAESLALAAQRYNLGGVTIPAALDPALRAAVRHAIDASFISGFRHLMLLSALLAILSALAAATMIRPRPAANGANPPAKSSWPCLPRTYRHHKIVILAAVGRRLFFAFASCEHAGPRRGGTPA
jgi:EmrB/QacA subfamily drug resistance transporter